MDYDEKTKCADADCTELNDIISEEIDDMHYTCVCDYDGSPHCQYDVWDILHNRGVWDKLEGITEDGTLAEFRLSLAEALEKLNIKKCTDWEKYL